MWVYYAIPSPFTTYYVSVFNRMHPSLCCEQYYCVVKTLSPHAAGEITGRPEPSELGRLNRVNILTLAYINSIQLGVPKGRVPSNHRGDRFSSVSFLLQSSEPSGWFVRACLSYCTKNLKCSFLGVRCFAEVGHHWLSKLSNCSACCAQWNLQLILCTIKKFHTPPTQATPSIGKKPQPPFN